MPSRTSAVFDPTSASWYVHDRPAPGAPTTPVFRFGAAGWQGLLGDWDGNGTDTVGVFDPSTATWYLKNSNQPGAPDIAPFRFGAPGWIPVVGDWDGNGTTTIGVVDPATMTWYLRNSNSAGAPDISSFRFGAPGWIPVVGDWDGNGTATIGAVDPATETWYLRNSNSPGAPDIAPFRFGAPGWVPVAGDWDGNGTASAGVFDPASAAWYLRDSNSPGAPDVAPFSYGAPTWQPLAGSETHTGTGGTPGVGPGVGPGGSPGGVPSGSPGGTPGGSPGGTPGGGSPTSPPGDTTAPVVSLTAPASGATVAGTVTVTANASDNVGVAGVQFLLDGQALGAEDTAAPYSVSWNTAGANNGTHTLTARARDAAGNTATSAAVTLTVSNVLPPDTAPPTVSLTAPKAGATVAGTVSITATASDNVGVAGVQFLLDGQALGAEDTAAPYSVSWNTAGAANGTHTLSARARDAAGNKTTSAAVTVTVSNNSSGGAQPFPNNGNPPALPAPTGTVINVSTVSQLQSAVANLQSNQTIVIASGTYNLTGTLYVPQNLTNIAIRGASGKASDVIIKGDAVIDSSAPYTGSAIWGSGSGISGSMPFGIWLGNVQTVTVADLTLQNYVYDAIILNAGVQSPLIHDVVMLDTGEQLLKSNPNGSGGGVNNGVVEYCTIGYTTAAPNNYTNGIDVHTGQNWTIRNNLFQNILTTNPLATASSGALAGPAVLVWNGSKNFTTVGNTFVNCQREVAYGLSDPSSITDDNTGGLIANNFIYRSGGQHGDVSIGVWNSPNTVVVYNTVILNGDYPNAVEYRFNTTTGVLIENNLTDSAIISRDGATGTVANNLTSAQPSWFVNASAGNLHLVSTATAAIDHGITVASVTTDYDGQSRPAGASPDIGADEYVP